MIRRFALAALLLLSASALFAQDRAPSALFEATQCLVTGKYEWIDPGDQKVLQLAYHVDKKTFSGAHYLYVIVFNSNKRDSGKVFDIRLKEHHTYSIENNAKFAIAPDKSITFPEPPLGGNWAQNQMTNTVHQILKHRKWYEAEVKQLQRPSPKLNCETVVEDVVNPTSKK
jgi:hypothetical protein